MNILERLKSPVFWGGMIIIIQDRLNILEQTGITWQNVTIGILMILLAGFQAINNPADRDKM